MTSKDHTDIKDGTLITKYENGNTMLEAKFKNGQRYGPFTIWYESGQKMLQGECKVGYPDGKTTTWFENGQIRQEAEFLNGIPHGSWKTWYENGKKREEGHYLHGKKIGIWREWSEIGELVADEVHDGIAAHHHQGPREKFAGKPVFFGKRLITHAYFRGLATFTGIYMLLASILFYYFESSLNPRVSTIAKAFGWVVSTVPVLGHVDFKPVTTGGLLIASAAHLCGFFVFCFWLALLGWAVFSQHYERTFSERLNSDKKQ